MIFFSPRNSSGTITFSNAVNVGNNWKILKYKANKFVTDLCELIFIEFTEIYIIQFYEPGAGMVKACT